MIPSQTRNWFTLCQDCLLVLKCVFSFQTNRTWVGWRNALVLGSGGKTHSYLGRVAETGGETHSYLGRVTKSETLCSEGMSAIHLVQLVLKV